MKDKSVNVILFSIIYILILSRAIIGNTTFSEYVHIYGDNLYLLFAIVVPVVFLKLIFFTRFTYKKVFFCLIYCIIAFGNFRATGHIDLCLLFILVVSAIDIKPEIVVKIHFYTYSIITLVAIVCAILGIIDNYTVISTVHGVRYSLGNTYPTDFGAGYLFLLFDLFFLYYKNLRPLCSVVLIFVSIVVYIYTKSTTTFILSIVLCIYSFKPYLGKLSHLVKYSFPLFAASSILITQISAPILTFIDQLLSYRLTYSSMALTNFPITLFGNDITMYGAGWNTPSSGAYFYVVNAYIAALLSYGFVFLVILCFSFMFLSYKYQNSHIEIIFMLIAVSSLLEPRLYNYLYCSYLLIVPYYFDISSSRWVVSGVLRKSGRARRRVRSQRVDCMVSPNRDMFR